MNSATVSHCAFLIQREALETVAVYTSGKPGIVWICRGFVMVLLEASLPCWMKYCRVVMEVVTARWSRTRSAPRVIRIKCGACYQKVGPLHSRVFLVFNSQRRFSHMAACDSTIEPSGRYQLDLKSEVGLCRSVPQKYPRSFKTSQTRPFGKYPEGRYFGYTSIVHLR